MNYLTENAIEGNWAGNKRDMWCYAAVAVEDAGRPADGAAQAARHP